MVFIHFTLWIRSLHELVLRFVVNIFREWNWGEISLLVSAFDKVYFDENVYKGKVQRNIN